MYNDSQLTITTHIPLSERGGGGSVSSETFYPPTDSEPPAFQTKRFRKGDVNPSNGTIFWCYADGKKRQKELWLTPEQFVRKHEYMRISNRKYEARVDRNKRNAKTARWYRSKRGRELVAARNARPEVRARKRELDRLRRMKNNQRPEVIAAKEARHRQQEEARRLRATPEYQMALRERENQRAKENYKKRYGKDSQYTTAMRVRARVLLAIKAGGASKAGRRTEELIGCSFDYLRQHIERQFKGNMSWDKPGSFHIDHVIPLAAFDLTDPQQLKVACNWQNMQPLAPKKNMRKGAKILNGQQPLPLSVHSQTFNTQAA
jgi:hypothetical protein